MAEDGKGGIATAAGAALAAGGAVVGVVGHTPAPTVLVGATAGAAMRTEGQFAGQAIGISDDVFRGSADDMAGGLSSLPRANPGIAVGRSAISAANVGMQGFSYVRTQRMSEAYSTISTAARPEIVRRISGSGSFMSQADIQKVVSSSLASAASKKAVSNPSQLKFEVLTGKITADKEITGKLGTITFGEINIYKTSVVAAGGIAICRTLPRNKVDNCVGKALDKAGDFTKSALTVSDLVDLQK